MSTPYHAKYYAAELLRRSGSGDIDQLSMSLFDASVDLNPHQIEAALFACRSPLSKGVLLADEVGLGKTIEAGLVLCQYWAERRRRLIVICPAALRKQWSLELAEKFNLPSVILEAKSFKEALRGGSDNPFNANSIVITSLNFATLQKELMKLIPWDLAVIDEAHKLRNAYRPSNRMGQGIRWALEDRKKLLLTATPLQNSLLELYGLSTLIDDHIFGDLPSFREQYTGVNSDFDALKRRLAGFAKRTLRSQVLEYIRYTERRAITRPFHPSDQEQSLYEAISNFLQRADTYAIPDRQRTLTTLIVRKLLASSTQAVAGTLETIRQRLEALRAGLPEPENLLEDLIDGDELGDDFLEEEEETETDEVPPRPQGEGRGEGGAKQLNRQQLDGEIAELNNFIAQARQISVDTKTRTLCTALEIGFAEMEKMGASRKSLIFTESRRTQEYLKTFLETNGFAGRIVLFNGSNTDPESNVIFEQWLKGNAGSGRISGSKTADRRTALIEHFRDNAEIMLATEAAAEGVNLQFCSMVINYDLPWNPQRIEQRIGRCHRYGQNHDVVVINFLNERNDADRRVYELLTEKFNLFSGVFGASDDVLGSIETGVDFERRILRIYQECRSTEEIETAFTALQAEMEQTIASRMTETRQTLLEHFDEDVHSRLKVRLDQTRHHLDRFSKLFWSVTKSVLEQHASFDDENLVFDLQTPPIVTPQGRYHLISKNRHNIEGEFLYSYKFFYDDGYGKESLILNLSNDDAPEIRDLYFTACLLSFYQQQYLWERNGEKLADYNLEKPLWVFVGNKVNDEDSDLLDVVRFLAGFLNNDSRAKEWIKDLIENRARLLDTKQRDIFHDRFLPLLGQSPDAVYADILKRLFNSDSRQRLKLINMKGCSGELALRVGDEPFGLINIGDDTAFYKLCEEQTDFDTEADEFAASLFGSINRKDSRLHILIGSRKFTEGWSSWRVSTMGLLNMGQGEGSQIIQLFGRGVRLKGQNYSLKRSTPGQRPKGLHLERLETLNIFGVRAGYMAKFKEYLQEEGITPSDEIIELNFETRPNLPKDKLKTLSLKDGYKDNQKNGFKRRCYPWLYETPPEFTGKIKPPHIELDLYPRLEALATQNKGTTATTLNVRHKGKLSSAAMAMFDFDRIYLAVQDFKLQRSMSNLRLDRARLEEFCKTGNDWYTLYIPESELEINRGADIRKLEDILIRLLQDYTDRFYKTLKNAYEGQFYEVISMRHDDDSMLKVYHFEIQDTDEGQVYLERLEELKKLVASGTLGEVSSWNGGSQMVAICFDRHLFYPLMSIEGDLPLKMRPLAFDAPSEIRFVKDLEKFYSSAKGKDVVGGRSLYLLRNADTKAKGLGFALAGNFYPDFLLWLVDDASGKQWLSFVDPKGIRQMGLNDPKFGLYKEVKILQEKLADPQLVLNAFILSATAISDWNSNGGCTEQELEDRHLLFMGPEKQAAYLEKMFVRMV